MRQLFVFLLVSFGVHAQASSNCPDGLEEIPLTDKNWQTAYDGYGRVSLSNGEIKMSPQAARSPQSTHATLILSKLSVSKENFDIFVEYKNLKALREPAANPWELLWVFFQYQGEQPGAKRTNYVVAKTNGLEIGKAFGSIEQTFLKTSSEPRAEFNKWHLLRIRLHEGKLQVTFDRQKTVVLTETDKLFGQSGQIGLYSEDASVSVRRVCVLREMTSLQAALAH